MTIVSVVIPAYNREQCIKKAIQSVLSQTYPSFEIIIVDDGSTDNTSRLVATFVEEDQRIRHLQHDLHRGAQAARNSGIRAARGEWIAFLDSDDQWLPHSIEKRLKVAQNEGVKIVHSECYIIREDGNMKHYGLPPMAGDIYRDVLTRPGPAFPALLIAKGALENIGYLDEQIIAYQEWDTTIRLAKHYSFSFVNEPTFIYDCRGNDTISKDKQCDARGYEQVVHKHILSILQVAGPRVLSQHYLEIAFRYQATGNAWVALRYKILALLCWPFRPGLIFRKVRQILKF